jgi:hypothetical protein
VKFPPETGTSQRRATQAHTRAKVVPERADGPAASPVACADLRFFRERLNNSKSVVIPAKAGIHFAFLSME